VYPLYIKFPSTAHLPRPTAHVPLHCPALYRSSSSVTAVEVEEEEEEEEESTANRCAPWDWLHRRKPGVSQEYLASPMIWIAHLPRPTAPYTPHSSSSSPPPP